MQEISGLQESDFPHISTNLDKWWGGRNMVPMLPRLWFQDFQSTSFVIRGDDFQPIAFLVGYISQTDKSKAYVHFIGVDPGFAGLMPSPDAGELIQQQEGKRQGDVDVLFAELLEIFELREHVETPG